jgi:hypothetical protein
MVAHANAMLDAYIYGFALLEASLPSQAEGEFVGVVEDIASAMDADAYPNLVGFTIEHVFQPGYEFSDTFEVGLDVILDAVGGFARDTSPGDRAPSPTTGSHRRRRWRFWPTPTDMSTDNPARPAR